MLVIIDVADPSNPANDSTTLFTYDAGGRRVSKEVEGTGSSATYYVFRGIRGP
jgi:hypothetical protein